MKIAVIIVATLIILLAGIDSMASDIHVPTRFATIQRAIDEAVDGDTILVAAGIYYENIVIDDKNIVIASQSSDPKQTIIDGTNIDEPVVRLGGAGYFELRGFTLTGGKGTGGGLYCVSSETAANIVLHNLRIVGNKSIYANNVSAGMYFSNCKGVKLSNSTIANNIGEGAQSFYTAMGAIEARNSDIHIRNVAIHGNVGHSTVRAFGNSKLDMDHVTIAGNDVKTSAISIRESWIQIHNSIVWNEDIIGQFDTGCQISFYT